MSNKIKIDTAVVANTADMIESNNNLIRDALPPVVRQVNTLGTFWEGEASVKAMSTFRRIQTNYFDARYNEVNRLVLFLKKQVCEGYENTERVVSAAAAAFK